MPFLKPVTADAHGGAVGCRRSISERIQDGRVRSLDQLDVDCRATLAQGTSCRSRQHRLLRLRTLTAKGPT